MIFKNFLTLFICALLPEGKRGEGRGGDPRTVVECRHDFKFESVVSYEATDTSIKKT